MYIYIFTLWIYVLFVWQRSTSFREGFDGFTVSIRPQKSSIVLKIVLFFFRSLQNRIQWHRDGWIIVIKHPYTCSWVWTTRNTQTSLQMSTPKRSAQRPTSSTSNPKRSILQLLNKAAENKQCTPEDFDSILEDDTIFEVVWLLDESHWMFQEGVEILSASSLYQKTRTIPIHSNHSPYARNASSLICRRRTTLFVA